MIAIYVLSLASIAASLHIRPLVNTTYGPVKGSVKMSRSGRPYNSFTGIPFAKPPIGDLRFAAPEEPAHWSYVLDASKPSPICIQRDFILFASPAIVGEEDCLYLNVYVPMVNNGRSLVGEFLKPHIHNHELLPVLVYIFWGGFLAGRSDSDYLGPEYIMDQNIILVTINYRLGPFGFLSTSDDEAPGNYGMKDQVIALKWVQNNIKRFWGDPDRVTIAGQSSGAASVHLHMLSESSKGLFHQAISQSATALSPFAIVNSTIQYQIALAQAALVGCGTSNSSEVVQCLRETSAEDILNSQDSFRTFYGNPLMVYTCSVENKSENNPEPFLTQTPVSYLKSGEFQKIPWLVGVVKNEGNINVAGLLRNETIRDALNEDFQTLLSNTFLGFPFITSNVSGLYTNVSQFYLGGQNYVDVNNTNSVQGFIDLYSDYSFFYQVYRSLRLQIPNGHDSIYLYSFEYVGEYSYGSYFAHTTNDINFNWGTSHCDDLLYIFKSPGLFSDLHNETDNTLSKDMIKILVNFVTYGNPNPDENPVYPQLNWQPVTINNTEQFNDQIKLFNITGNSDGINVEVTTGFYKERIQFWLDNNISTNYIN